MHRKIHDRRVQGLLIYLQYIEPGENATSLCTKINKGHIHTLFLHILTCTARKITEICLYAITWTNHINIMLSKEARYKKNDMCEIPLISISKASKTKLEFRSQGNVHL